MNCTSKERGLSCDGHGYVCLPHGICVCDSGWTGLNPFLGGHNNSCDVHEDTMFGLAIIESLLASIYILIVLRHIGKRLIMTKNLKLFLHDPKTLCSCFFFLIGATDIALSVSYLVHSRKRASSMRCPLQLPQDSTLSFVFLVFQHIFKFSCIFWRARWSWWTQSVVKRYSHIWRYCGISLGLWYHSPSQLVCHQSYLLHIQAARENSRWHSSLASVSCCLSMWFCSWQH